MGHGHGARKVALAQLLVGVLLLVAVWTLLPARYLPIDALGSVLGAVCVVSGAGLLSGAAWGLRLARVVSIATLVCGLGLTSALAVTVAHLAGSYGPVGAGGAALMAVIAALLLPYLVGLPLLQLTWLRQKP